MKNLIPIILFVPLWINQTSYAQDVYPISSSEFLFQFADIENSALSGVNNNMRFTVFINYGQYWHADFNNNLGLYSGLAVRNVGFIYDTPDPSKIIRRSYNVGLPLAVKIGDFDKNMYLMAGGEYELLFHYRARKWNSNDRKGSVIKDSEWFSDKTHRFVPSFFAGVQFPGGINLKFKYYLKGFLDENYSGPDLGGISDFADFTKLDIFYVSLCWQFRTDRVKDLVDSSQMAKAD
jgi:hypothetical protein